MERKVCFIPRIFKNLPRIFIIFTFCGLVKALHPAGAGVILSSGPQNPPSRTVSNVYGQVILLQIKVFHDHPENAYLKSFTVHFSGSGNDAACIAAGTVRLYRDNNSNALIDSGDVQKGIAQTITVDNGTVFFSGLSDPLLPGSAAHFIVAADFAGTAYPGDSFSISVLSPNDLAAETVSGTGLSVYGAPVRGASVWINTDTAAPRSLGDWPPADKNPAVPPTNVIFSLTFDEPVYTGGRLRITDFQAAALVTTNILFTANADSISAEMDSYIIECGTWDDSFVFANLANNRSFYNGSAYFTLEGVVNEWWSASSVNNGQLNFYIASGAGTTLTLEHSVPGIAPFDRTWTQFTNISAPVKPGWRIGIYAATGRAQHGYETGTLLQKNNAHSGTEVFTSASGYLPALYARGYAYSTYISSALDTGNDTPDYRRVIWHEASEFGTLSAAIRTAAGTNMSGASAWVSVTNNQLLTGLAKQRYAQFRLDFEASHDGESGPRIDELIILHDISNVPALVILQSNFADASVYAVDADYLSGSGSGPFSMQAPLAAGYNGTAEMRASVFDFLGNYVPEMPAGSIIVDGLIPDITNPQCFADVFMTIPVTNHAVIPDRTVTFLFNSSPVISKVRYYYSLSNQIPASIDYTFLSTASNILYDMPLFTGTNYFTVRAVNDAGTWGSPAVFSAVFEPKPLYIQLGSMSRPDQYLASGSADQPLLQISLSTDSTGYSVHWLRIFTDGTLDGQQGFVPLSFALYLDDGNGLFDGTEILLDGSRSFNPENNSITFMHFSNVIMPFTNVQYLVVAGIDQSAQGGAYFTLRLDQDGSISNTALDLSATNVGYGLPITGNSNIIQPVSMLTAVYGSANDAPGIVPSGSAHVPMLQLTLSADAADDVTITSFSIRGSGTGNEAVHIRSSGVMLVRDIDNDGMLSAEDVPAAGGKTYFNDNGAVLFSGLSIPVQAGTACNLLVLYSFEDAVPDSSDFMLTAEDCAAVSVRTGAAALIQGLPVSGPKRVINTDVTPPQIYISSAEPSPAAITNVSIILASDEAVYSGGRVLTDTDFPGGLGDNLILAAGSCRINTLRLFGGFTNSFNGNPSQGVLQAANRPWINTAAQRSINTGGVITMYEGVSRTAGASLYFYLMSNTGGNNYVSLTNLTWSTGTPFANTIYAVSNVSMRASQGNFPAMYVRNGTPGGARNAAGSDGTAYSTRNVFPESTPAAYTMVGGNNDNVYLAAHGYAVSTFTSKPLALDTGYSNILYFDWTENLSGGGSVRVMARGAANEAGLDAASWYSVQKKTAPSPLTNELIRYVQYRAVLSAAWPYGGTISPELTSFSISYGWKEQPVCFSTAGGITNYSVYHGHTAEGHYIFSNNFAPQPGNVNFYASGIDRYGNAASDFFAGSIIYDPFPPAISNLQCWRSPLYADPVSNGVLFHDETVSFTWDHSGLAPAVFYYTLTNTSETVIFSESFAFTDSKFIDDTGLPAGTNYMHIRAKSGAGLWGHTAVFTNVYAVPVILCDPGANSPLPYTAPASAVRAAIIQVRVYNGTASSVTLRDIVFSASGSGNELNGLISGACRLYLDNGNGEYDEADVLLDSTGFTADDGTLSYQPELLIPGSSSRLLLVTYDFSGAAETGHTFRLSLESENFLDIRDESNIRLTNGIMQFPLSGAFITVQQPSFISLDAGSPTAPLSKIISNFYQDVVMLQIRAHAPAAENVSLNSLLFTSSGTGDDSLNVESGSVRLYYDSNRNGFLEKGFDPLLSAGSWNADNGTFSASGLTHIIPAGTNHQFLLVQNFNATAVPSKNFRAYLASNIHLEIHSLVTGLAVPVTNAPVFGTLCTMEGDADPPFIQPYMSFSAPSPAEPVSNVSVYTYSDEPVRNTNSAGVTNNWPDIRIIQGAEVRQAQYFSGGGSGPFTHYADLRGFTNGSAQVWANSFDFALPANHTNRLVGILTVLSNISSGTPDIICTKSNFVTSPFAGGTITGTDLIPGSTVTWVLYYTNRGDGTAWNTRFEEVLNPSGPFLGIMPAEFSGIDLIEYALDETYTGYTPPTETAADYSVRKIRMTVFSIPPGAAGNIMYKAVIR